MDFEWPLFMIRMGDTWREGRKLLDGNLRSGAIVTYRQMMQEKTREFLVNLFCNPKGCSCPYRAVSWTSSLYRMTINGRTAFRDNLSCQSRMATA